MPARVEAAAKEFGARNEYLTPSPLEGEGWDEGGIPEVRHPSPYPLPQGARVYGGAFKRVFFEFLRGSGTMRLAKHPSKNLFFMGSPSPLEGEGWDEGGIPEVRHPSPYPLPQGARVFSGAFNRAFLEFLTAGGLKGISKNIFLGFADTQKQAFFRVFASLRWISSCLLNYINPFLKRSGEAP
jgi:hypothetical protein